MKNLICLFAILLSFIASVSGQTWNVIPSGTNKELNAISFPSASVGYIAGNDSVLLKTIDGGLNWSQMDMQNFPFVGTSQDLIDVEFVTDDIGYLSMGPYYGTLKTIDGGLTWSVVNQIYACFNHGLYFFDENNGFLGGSGCFSGEIINKLDTGTWIETNVTPAFIQSSGMINNFDFYDDSLGLATSSTNYFFRTSNGGFTWDTINSGLGVNNELTSVLFVDSSRVLGTYNHTDNGEFGVVISMDGGLTWQPDLNSATFFYPRMNATEKSGNDQVFVGGGIMQSAGAAEPGIIYQSDDQMVFWTYETVEETINDFGSHSDSVVFAVGDSGYIIVNQPLAGLSIEEEAFENDLVVFPNPSNGAVHISNLNFAITEIEVFNTQGAKVKKGTLSKNTDKEWTIENLHAGIYLVKIRSDERWYSKKVVIF